MSNNNTFIDVEFVLEKTALQKNVLNTNRSILEAQKLYIEMSIGKYTSSILLDNYINGRVIEGTVEAEVIENIQEALAYFTIVVILPNIHFKLTENGVFLKESTGNIAVEARDLEYRITQYRKNAEIFLNRAIDLLEENQHLFPHYSNKSKALMPNRTNTIGGILFREYSNCNSSVSKLTINNFL